MIFEFSVTAQLHYYAYTGRHEEGLELLPEVMERLDFYGDRINEQTRIYILYNACLLCLVGKDYKKGLPFLNELMNQDQHRLSVEQESMVRIFNMIYHFEFGNDSLLLHLAKSTYRFLYKSERLFKFETCILNFIKKTPAAISHKEMVPYFEKLRSDLSEFRDDPFENRPFEDFDYIAWLDSKINNRPFSEILRAKSDQQETDAMKVKEEDLK